MLPPLKGNVFTISADRLVCFSWDCAKTTGLISVTSVVTMGKGPRWKPLKVGVDSDKGVEPGVFILRGLSLMEVCAPPSDISSWTEMSKKS